MKRIEKRLTLNREPDNLSSYIFSCIYTVIHVNLNVYNYVIEVLRL